MYFFRPVFHGPEGHGFTSCQTVCALLSEKFGLAPTPLRLCNLPVGAPSGTAEAGDSTSRDLLCPKLGRDLTMTGRTPGGTLQRKAQPSRAERHRSQPWRGGWPERPNGSQLFNLTPGCKPSTEKVRPVAPLRTGLLLENRDLRSRAPPPPPAEGATSLLLRRLRGLLRKRTSPDGHCPRASEILFKRKTCV